MKRSIFYIGSLCWLLLLGGCQGMAAADAVPGVPAVRNEAATTIPAATAIPASVQTPEPEYETGPSASSVRGALPYAVDLDGDGADEILDVIALPSETDGCPRWTVSLTKGAEVKRFQTDILEDMPWDLWVEDLDEDGRYEIVFHGDAASDDYLIYVWRHDLTPVCFEPDDRIIRGDNDGNDPDGDAVFGGAIIGFEDGHIIIEGAVDMLGTHWGVRAFALGDDGIIGPVSSVWDFEAVDERFLEVTRELKAYAATVRKDPGEAFTVAPGERIYPLASDGFSRMWFRTDSGKTGVLILTPDEDTFVMWRIDGEPEAAFFEELPYSG